MFGGRCFDVLCRLLLELYNEFFLRNDKNLIYIWIFECDFQGKKNFFSFFRIQIMESVIKDTQRWLGSLVRILERLEK